MKEKKSNKKEQDDLEMQLFFLEEEDLSPGFPEVRPKKPRNPAPRDRHTSQDRPAKKRQKPVAHREPEERTPVRKLTRREMRAEAKAEKKAQKQAEKQRKAINKEFAAITYAFVCLFLVLMGYIVYFNAVRAKDIINSPYNNRQDSFADRVVRGMILDADGNILARTNVEEDGSEWREYPNGSVFGHVVGYSVKGKSGLEAAVNFELLTSNAFLPERMMRQLQDQKNIGDNVFTTLNSNLQQTAYNALGNNPGAVIVLEPATGKILAMVSRPSFDPNYVGSMWDELINNSDGILVNRSTQGQYAPGSTFKVVTALEYIREHPTDYMNYSYDCQGEITVDGTTIRCFDGAVHGTVNLESSLAYSCNTSFANIGLQLNMSSFQETAKELLFNSSLPSPVLYNRSSFALEESANSAERMMTAMGQGDSTVSPYHMALITAAVANGGIVMEPYLVGSIANYQGSVIRTTMPKRSKTIMSAEEASVLARMMTSVVDYGTGASLGYGGYSVAGKTGTAEYSVDKEKTHSWFMGYSNIDNPDIVVSVVVESSDTTGLTAVNVAHQVFNAYYY